MDIKKYDKNTQELIKECENLYASNNKLLLRQLRQLEGIAKETEDNGLLGLVYFYYANWYYDYSQFEKFQNSLKQAIHSLLRSNDYELLARSYNFFGINAQINDAYDVAYTYYMNALQFTNEEESPSVTGIVIHNLANFYYEIGDYQIAKKYFHKALKLIKENKDDPLYHRNLIIACLSDGTNSLAMKDLAAAKKTHLIIKKELKNIDINKHRDVYISTLFFETRIALNSKDKTGADEKLNYIINSLNEEAMSFVETNDVVDFCKFLISKNKLDAVGKIISIVSPLILQSDMTHAQRLLTELKIDYYDKINDDKKLEEALRNRHNLLIAQKDEKEKIYKYSMSLISLVADLQEERNAVRLENEHLQIQILMDDLTGIANRYALDQELSQAFERIYKTKETLGIEILDVDDFKNFNDTYGHQAGDFCLSKIGNILKNISKDEGIFCARYGGDEFVLIYEGKSDKEIKNIAKRIDFEVKEGINQINNIKINKQVTVSQGICNDIPRIKSKPWDFLKEADIALYSIKGKRNSVIPIRKLPEFN